MPKNNFNKLSSIFSFFILLIASCAAFAADPSEHLVMGNPSNAVQDVNVPENYLLLKDQFVMSYSRDRGIPNWVSWHLDMTWIGSAPRQNNFRSDTSLPTGWYRALSSDYTNSGFDRGHLTPSADRTLTINDNSATFLMSNIMPQSPDNNQGPWEKLETYSRTLVDQGNELYIIAGGIGAGGTGSNGNVTTIANGKIVVPQYTWKVILVLPDGADDVSRVNNFTRTIAVVIPNTQGIRNDSWETYAVSVDQIESLTGFDFFSNVPTNIQAVIESRIGVAPTASEISISGRVITPQGFGLVNARVTLTDSEGNSRTVLTRQLGGFRFDDVASGKTYILTVASKRYLYTPQVFTPTENSDELIIAPYQNFYKNQREDDKFTSAGS